MIAIAASSILLAMTSVDPALAEWPVSVPTLLAQIGSGDVSNSELAARIDSLRTEILEILTEKDRGYQQRFDAQQAALFSALASAKEAAQKVEDDLNKRFDSVNEFRRTLSDQAVKFENSDTAAAKYASIEASDIAATKEIDALGERVTAIESKSAGSNGTIEIEIAVIGVVLAGVTVWFMRPKPPLRRT